MFGYLQRAVIQFLDDVQGPVTGDIKSALAGKALIPKVEPSDYADPAEYFKAACAVALLKKLRGFGDSRNKRDAAVKKWFAGEAQCHTTNRRLDIYLPKWRNFEGRDRFLEQALGEIRAIVEELVGGGPSLDDVIARARFGPGATYSDRGQLTTVPHKMTSAPSMTRRAKWFLLGFAGTQWSAALAAHDVAIEYVEGNRFSTVPKNSETDRSIGTEPSFNIFYQLGVGDSLRSQLRRRGWDLDHAQKVHRKVARQASRDRSFTTIDLANASDTVSRVLVELLLPHRWFVLLNELRSPKTLIDGRWVMLEKFSSMGNGYTFELETVIFAAAAIYATRKCGYKGQLGLDTFVYGDDIIVKDGVERVLFPVLKFLGFSLNTDKSFFGSVPFRESCGGDYWNGLDVRPYFPKEIPCEPQEIIGFANGLRANLEKLALIGESLPLRSWHRVVDTIPVSIRRCRGPKDLGDLVIHDDVPFWDVKVVDGIRLLRCYRPVRTRKVRLDRFHPEVVLASATYGVTNAGSRGNDGNIVPRDGVKSYGVRWIPFS